MKARDLISGWPRGRSTSRPIQEPPRIGSTEWSGLRKMDFDWDGRKVTVNVSDAQMREAEGLASVAEERRKAEMMECWYENQRLITAFNIPPELIKMMLTDGGTGILTADTLRSYLESLGDIQSTAMTAIVPRKIGPLGCGCCPGGKHKPWFTLIGEREP